MRENKHQPYDLKQMQSVPLEGKILMSNGRIRQWFEYWEGKVYVSFSGGKDSTVLADLCARVCARCGWTLYLLFVNTGLEYPEIQKFVKVYAEWLRKTYEIEVRLDIVRPEMRFDEVLKKHGYPIISKEVASTIHGARNSIEKGVYSHRLCKLGVGRDEYGGLVDEGKFDYEKNLSNSMFLQPQWRYLLNSDFKTSNLCCDVMKKRPVKKYEKKTGRKAIIGTMAEESMSRKNAWLKNGCNAFSAKRPTSSPLSFWTEQDILHYIKKFNVPYCSVYGDIRVKPREGELEGQINLIDCIGNYDHEEILETTGCHRTGCIFCAFGITQDGNPNRFQRLKETHPRQYAYCIGGGEMVDGKWQPSKEGLGLGHVLDYIGVPY